MRTAIGRARFTIILTAVMLLGLLLAGGIGTASAGGRASRRVGHWDYRAHRAHWDSLD